MSNTTISPSMNLPIPTVGTDPGPDWATNINACLTAIDSHNHTSGQGVPITPAAININTDLLMNVNNLITARSVRFSSQQSPIALATDLGCLYESGVDLYYNDGNGNQIRLTASGSPAGASGTITGLPSGTASASFAGTTFSFQSATNTPATMNVGPIVIGQPVASGFSVTISPSVSQASSYALVMPLALPSAPSNINSDASGNLSFIRSGANIRGVEGAGTTTLTSSDAAYQIFNLSAARTVLLPSSGVTAGDQYIMENQGAGTLTVQSSGANQLSIIDSLYASVKCTALVNSPTTAAHWKISFTYTNYIYKHGTTYNGGIAPTITLNSAGTISNLNYSRFIPYQTNDGSWYLNGRFQATISSASRLDEEFAINGLLFANIGDQGITGYSDVTSQIHTAFAESNSNAVILHNNGSVTVTACYFSYDDLILASKPTWAY